MSSAEKNPEFGGVCSKTCLGLQHFQVIFTSGSHLDAEGGLDLSKAGGALNWVSAVSGGFCLWFLSRNHILPASVFPSISFLCGICAWHWFWALLYAAKQLLCPTSKWASLHSWKKKNPLWIRRGCFIHPVWNIALLTWVCRGHLESSLWKYVRTRIAPFPPLFLQQQGFTPIPITFSAFQWAPWFCLRESFCRATERREESCRVFCQMEFGK